MNETIHYQCPQCAFARDILPGNAGYNALWEVRSHRLDHIWAEASRGEGQGELVKVRDHDTPLAPGDELRALIEAELILSAHWHERHGCTCGRHL